MARNALAEEILALTSALVKVDSVMGKEGPCAGVLIGYFNGKGVPAWLQEVEPNRFNVIAGSDDHKPALLLNGHMDMVDTADGWSTADPYTVEVIDGAMIGTGVGNMKAGLAAMAVATAHAWHSGAHDVAFLGVVGECSELGLGTKHYLADGGSARFAVVGEPTGMAAQQTHTGTYQAHVSFTGIAVHTGESENGVNAVEAAARFVLDIKRAKLAPPGTGPFEGTPRAMPGRMTGGFYAQISAPEASVWVDVRIPPGVDERQIESALDTVAAQAAASVSASDASANWKRASLAYEPAYSMSPEAKPFLDQLAQSYERVVGSDLAFGFATPANRFFATDAAHLQAAGVPSIVFGPGVWTVGPDEAVSLDEAANYAATLIELAASVATTGVQQ
jgi:acetylornithine deacetylase/succinyl-diaminopimelate desuccinylase-like protein